MFSAGTANAEPDQGLSNPLNSSSFTPETYSDDDLQIVESFVSDVLALVSQDWSVWFREQGLQEPRVGYVTVMPGETFPSTCHDVDGTPAMVDGNTANAFYCSTDTVVEGYQGTIIVPVLALRRIWDGDLYDRAVDNPGDVTVATVLAHEFGHHVIDELVTQGVRPQNPVSGKNEELLADCLAGKWVASAYNQGYLGDNPEASIRQAIEAMTASGDYEITAPDHHGTPSERSNALRIGIYGSVENPQPGNPLNCFSKYWD